MSVEFRRCLPEHLQYIQVQDIQRFDQSAMLSTEYAEIATSHIALSAWVGNTCIGAAGIVPMFPHRLIAWALFGRTAGPHFPAIVRKIRQVLRDDPSRRIEMTVDAEFKAGHRLALAVGMKLETPEPMRGYGARGQDQMMYVRIR